MAGASPGSTVEGMLMDNGLETVEIDSGPAPEASIIWLHGLGADGHDFTPIVSALDLPVAVRFIFPHAPVRPVTINGGIAMRAWYDIVSLERTDLEDERGIRQSAAQVAGLIHAEADRGIPSERVVLAGFSQGGAIVLHSGLRYPDRLAGVLALSTYLPLPEALALETAMANEEIPVFMAHGTADPTVPCTLAQESRQHLQAGGYDVEWHTYSMGHSVCPEEVADINCWLRERLPQAT